MDGFSPAHGMLVRSKVSEKQENREFQVDTCPTCDKKFREAGLLESMSQVR